MSTPLNELLDPVVLERIQHLSLVARRVAEGAMHGLHRSHLHGLSVEFAQHREYSPGDEIKHIDWQVAARSDRYVVKQYELETNLRSVILVDASASMAYGGQAGEQPQEGGALPATPATIAPVRRSKFHYARVLAAGLAYLLVHQGDSVGLMVSADRIDEQLAAAGHARPRPEHLPIARAGAARRQSRPAGGDGPAGRMAEAPRPGCGDQRPAG